MALRRPRRSVVVVADTRDAGDRAAQVLADSLADIGVESILLGREESAQRIAAVAAAQRADAVELCVGTTAGKVLLLRALLRELIRLGRRDVSIVVHRVD
jgi:methylmalonyl-CoA mutase cobalamin-binding domain/chain